LGYYEFYYIMRIQDTILYGNMCLIDNYLYARL
jgi:hypothetical protein